MANQKDIDNLFKKVDKGIWEFRKEYAKEITKKILIGIWSVTIFPLLLLWIWLTNDTTKWKW